ncbi:MAG: T9SS type A sorting domain-containing protein, partial [Bacteroidota bacterium]
CFIPTFSALAIPEPSDITAPVDCSMSSADKCVASVDNTTILSFTGLPDHNQRHVRFSTKNANFFVYELTSLQGLNTINSIANRTYNFGETDEPFDPGVSGNNFSQRSTPTIISQSLDILSGGEVFINKGDRIDFTDVNFHPQNTVESNFTVSLNPRCSAVEVRVHDGGRMVVGDGNVENTGELIVEAETQLIIKTGGQLKINQDCKVIVKEGGRLVIENGGELSVGIRGQLVVEEDADLRIEGDALINLINPSANCHIQGKLAIQDKFDFPGYGYFQFDNTHELYLENDFYLYGRGKSHRFIRLNDNAELNFGSKLAWLENGRVEYGQYTKMVSEAGGTVKLYSVELLGNGDATGIYSNGGSRVQLQDTDLISFFRGVGMENSSSSVNLIGINSYFFNCFNGVDMANCRRADLVDCTFEAGDQGSYGMFLENVEEVNVRQTNMSGYDGPGAGLFEAAILSYNVNLLTVEGGTFEHNNCGIYCPLDGTVNVHLHSQATLRENRVGVLIDNSGWVKMDCARLIDNQEAGIGGNDIQLEIDACINSGDPTCGNIRSNHFEVSSGYHIDVCYLQSAPSNVLARGNYWKGYGNPNVTRIRLRGNGSGNCSGAIPIDRSFPLSAPPTDCSLNQEEPDPDVIIGRSQPATGQQPNKPTTQKEEFTHTEIQSIKLFPNPSQTSVTLQLPEGQYQVQVFDISGRKIRENRETQSVEWEVRQWDAGTYLIKILDLHSGIDTIEKLIVL